MARSSLGNVAAELDTARTATVKARKRFIVRLDHRPDRTFKRTAIESRNRMANLVTAEGPILERILEDTHNIWHDGLTRSAYGRFWAAQVATPWGRGHLRRYALADGETLLASAKLYTLDAVLDGNPIVVAGIGALFTSPASRGRGAARDLIEQLLARASTDGADLALLFSEIG